MDTNESNSPSEHLRLSGQFLALCAWCRRLRSDDGHWYELGGSVRADGFTHSICPDCANELRVTGRSN